MSTGIAWVDLLPGNNSAVVCYDLVDRSRWSDGPWNGEPDRVEWTDAATGLTCLARRGPCGEWNGYVRLPEDHAWRRFDVPANPDVHGGLTHEGQLKSEDGYWVGFDCAHLGDWVPELRDNDETYRDLAFVIQEIERLAVQTAAAAKGAGR